jgi:hypothetical protein
MCGVQYSMDLACGTTERRPHAFTTTTDASVPMLVDTIHDGAHVLAAVARSVPPGRRGHHVAGMADAEGFIAMEIDEHVIHTADVLTGLGSAFDAPDELVRRLLDRLFPWWPREAEPWQALLWANGRAELPGHANPGEAWVWHCAPLAEWSGRVPQWDPVARRRVD